MNAKPKKSTRNLKQWFSPTAGDLNGLRAVLLVVAILMVISTVFSIDGFGLSVGRADGEGGGWVSGFTSDSQPRGIVVDIDPEDLGDVDRSVVSLDRVQAVVPVDGTARILNLVGSVLAGLGILGAMLVAWVVLARAAKGRLFDPSSWKLLIAAAAVMMVAQIGEAVTALARVEALRTLDLTPMTSLSFGYGIMALVFVALARVWQVGSELADDVALTV